MKYKIGDKVKVKDDLELGKCYFMSDAYTRDTVDSEMLRFRGEEVTILCCTPTKKYSIREDGGEWVWTDEMFAGPATSTTKVVITTDGRTTTAKMFEGKKLLKTAKCSPVDTFDFAIGAKLALERVTEKEQKFKVGQFVRVINNKTNHFPIGQIVEIVDVSGEQFLCKGYCYGCKCISTQFVFDYQIEALSEDGQ